MYHDRLLDETRPRILVVLHQETSSSGRVGQVLTHMGYGLDIRRPVLGDPLPVDMSNHAGAVVFGGPMSANDDLEGVRRETAWMDVVLSSGKPYLAYVWVRRYWRDFSAAGFLDARMAMSKSAGTRFIRHRQVLHSWTGLQWFISFIGKDSICLPVLS